MRLAVRQSVALLLLGAFALLAPSLVAHGHPGTSLLPDLACAKCALVEGSAPATPCNEIAVAPLVSSEPAPPTAASRFVSTPRTTAVPRGPPQSSL